MWSAGVVWFALQVGSDGTADNNSADATAVQANDVQAAAKALGL